MLSENSPVTFILSAQSTTHNRNAIQNHRAILSLIVLTGCIDVSGGVLIPTARSSQAGILATQYFVGEGISYQGS